MLEENRGQVQNLTYRLMDVGITNETQICAAWRPYYILRSDGRIVGWFNSYDLAVRVCEALMSGTCKI